MISIIIPTLNERENLPELFQRIDHAMGTESSEYEVVLVDDDSPDRTWEKARELADDYPVNVVHRTEETGLATAILHGLEHARSDVLVVMDADLQHPPETIPRLLERMDDGCDLVVASRFAEGGRMEDFGMFRMMMTRIATLLAKLLFPRIRPVTDVLAGFFAFRRSVIPERPLKPTGYKILLELLVRGDYDRHEEVGFTFATRKAGESKLGLTNTFNFLRHLVRLYFT